MTADTKNILTVKGLKKYFPTTVKDKYVRAIDDIDFELRRGEVLGLVGESGSGKSTTAYAVMGTFQITEGSIMFDGRDISMPSKKRPLNLKKELQIVFQDPGTSLNTKRDICSILELPLQIHHIVPRNKRRQRAIELLEMVDLPEDYLYKKPTALGGGERQLVAIARALATDPKIIVLDEPTSALDVSVQAKIINTLMNLQKEHNLSFLFITHDMSLMRNISDRVAIMYLGKIMEIASTATFYEKPLHPYTQMLISSIPVASEEEEKLKPSRVQSQGEIPSPVNIPTGCRFNTRCPYAFERCMKEEPQKTVIDENHAVWCHLCEKETAPTTASSERENK